MVFSDKAYLLLISNSLFCKKHFKEITIDNFNISIPIEKALVAYAIALSCMNFSLDNKDNESKHFCLIFKANIWLLKSWSISGDLWIPNFYFEYLGIMLFASFKISMSFGWRLSVSPCICKKTVSLIFTMISSFFQVYFSKLLAQYPIIKICFLSEK